MALFKRRSRIQFHYTPMFLKEPKPDLRQQMRALREPDHFKTRYKVWHWLLLLVLTLVVFESLFPGSVMRYFRPGVEITLNDQLSRAADRLRELEQTP